MINAVGGTSIHWMTQSWRFLPWNFKIPRNRGSATARTRSRRTRPRSTGPSTTTSSSRTTTSTSTSPACPARPGTQGTIDPRGNIYEGPRRRPYPLPALRSSGWTDMRQGREVDGLAPVSRARRHPLEGLPRQGRLHVLRLLREHGLLHEREGSDQRRLHPGGREDEEPEDRHDGRRAPGRGRQRRQGLRRALPQGRPRVLPAGARGVDRRVHVRELPAAAPVDVEGLSRTASRTTTARWASTTSPTASARRVRPAGSPASGSTATAARSASTRRSTTSTPTTSTTPASGSSGAACAAPRWRPSRSLRRARFRRASRAGARGGRRGWRRTRTPLQGWARSSRSCPTRTTTSISTRPCAIRSAGR